MSQPENAPLLEVDDLSVEFFGRSGHAWAVQDVSFAIDRGETVAIVGESGSGKSVTARAILGMVEPPGLITGGDIRWKGESLVSGSAARKLRQRILGPEMTLVPQEPMVSLNPLMPIGRQLMEGMRHHLGYSKRQAWGRATELLDLVGIPSPAARMKAYPWEMSGGMQQRVLIASALACDPQLIIADEPTTALDVTVQAQIFELLLALREQLGITLLLITHDLGVVSETCDRVLVMYGGRILESGDVSEVMRDPWHPYSAGLIDATPQLDGSSARLRSIPGTPPDLRDPPSGCPFAPRCNRADDQCSVLPDLSAREDGRGMRCWHPLGGAHESDVMTEVEAR